MQYLEWPVAVLVGFGVQLCYMPSTSSGPLAGAVRIMLIALGAAMAYTWRWR